MTPLNCADMEALAPELACGILPGDERAEAVSHLSHCAACRLVVADLTQAVDTIVAAAPVVAPPKGLSRRVVKVCAKAPGDRSRSGGLPRRAAIAVSVAALALVAALAAPARDRLSPTAIHARSDSTVPTRTVQMAALVPVGDERIAGAVFVHPSSPAWVFMTVSDDDSSSTYTCELVYGDGHTLDVGAVALRGGTGSWRSDLPRATAPITKVNVRASDGTLYAQASLG